jgi:hypothetical protein
MPDGTLRSVKTVVVQNLEQVQLIGIMNRLASRLDAKYSSTGKSTFLDDPMYKTIFNGFCQNYKRFILITSFCFRINLKTGLNVTMAATPILRVSGPGQL